MNAFHTGVARSLDRIRDCDRPAGRSTVGPLGTWFMSYLRQRRPGLGELGHRVGRYASSGQAHRRNLARLLLALSLDWSDHPPRHFCRSPPRPRTSPSGVRYCSRRERRHRSPASPGPARRLRAAAVRPRQCVRGRGPVGLGRRRGGRADRGTWARGRDGDPRGDASCGTTDPQRTTG